MLSLNIVRGAVVDIFTTEQSNWAGCSQEHILKKFDFMQNAFIPFCKTCGVTNNVQRCLMEYVKLYYYVLESEDV